MRGVMGPVDELLAQKFSELWPLNERPRRLVLGAEAKALGRGGITAAARAAGISPPTVERTMAELSEPPEAIVPARSAIPAPAGNERLISILVWSTRLKRLLHLIPEAILRVRCV